MDAIMTSVMDRTAKLGSYIQECRSLGIDILAPDINESRGGFTVFENSIRYGLSAIKGVGRNVIDAIVKEREAGGHYRDLYDFVRRLSNAGINRGLLDSLIKAGAFDCFGLTRKQMINIYMDVLDDVARDKRSVTTGQMSLLDIVAPEQQQELQVKIPDVGEYDRETLLNFEKSVTGIFVSGHPLDEYRKLIEKVSTACTGDFMTDEEGHVNVKDNDNAVVAGLVSAVTKKTDKKGQTMAFVTLEDLFGSMEVIVFGRDYSIYRDSIYEGSKVVIRGRVSVKEDEDGKLIAGTITPFDKVVKNVWIRLPDMGIYRRTAEYIMSLKDQPNGRGRDKIVIYLSAEKQMKTLGNEYCINGDDAMLQQLKQRFGEQSIAVTYDRI